MIEDIQPLVSSIGILLQLAGALLLGALFQMLRRHARRRLYFILWGWAWLALCLGIAAIAVPQVVPLAVGGVVQFVYQFGKLVYLALLVAGTAAYARGTQVTPFVPVAVGLSAAYGLVSLYMAPDLRSIVAWQAPVAVLAFTWCGLRLILLPASRHGVGTRITGAVFLVMAVAWALYFPAFATAAAGSLLAGGVLDNIVRFNSYIDVLLHMILGCGMVVVLMEDAKREADDAHAELAVAHNELRRAALCDTVTGALNRSAFVEGVGLDTAKARFGAVIMVDLDDLKSVNDLHGHSAGDALLRHLADAVRAQLRPSDKLYRWGGDEFLLVLPGADAAGAEPRLRGVVANAATLVLPDGQQVRLSVSMGAAAYESAEAMVAAIDAADAVMYEEKNRKKQARRTGASLAR